MAAERFFQAITLAKNTGLGAVKEYPTFKQLHSIVFQKIGSIIRLLKKNMNKNNDFEEEKNEARPCAIDG